MTHSVSGQTTLFCARCMYSSSLAKPQIANSSNYIWKSMLLKQVEFLIQGYLLPMAIGRFQVSPSFVIEDAIAMKDAGGSFALAFLGVEDEHNFFIKASSTMNLFLMLHALGTGQAVTHHVGVATPLSTLANLGKIRVTFADYEKVTHLNEDMKSKLNKPILLTKERFLQLEPEMDKILDEHVGLALSYFYYAALSNRRRRFAEVVINLAIAAEALFTKERPYTRNLKRRLSHFIADNEPERKKIAEDIGKFYRLRGDIVHGKKKKVPLDDVRIAWGYIQKAIDKALSSRLYTKAELVQEADKN